MVNRKIEEKVSLPGHQIKYQFVWKRTVLLLYKDRPPPSSLLDPENHGSLKQNNSYVLKAMIRRGSRPGPWQFLLLKLQKYYYSAVGTERFSIWCQKHANFLSSIKTKETTLLAFNGTNLSFSFKRVSVQSICIVKHQVIVERNVCTVMTNTSVLLHAIMLDITYVISKKRNTLWLF